MIVIMSGKMQIPEEERFIGFVGDNLHSTKQFLLTDVSEQNCIYRLYLTFDDGTTNYFVLDNLVENGSTLLTWTVLEEHIFKSGVVNAQIKCFNADSQVYHTTSDYFIVASSSEYSDCFATKENAEFLQYERKLNAILSSIQSGNNAFVSQSRSIAGIDLADDISASELQQALNMYPILNTMYEPTTSLKGEIGQLCVGGLWDGEYKLYICIKAKDNLYTWQQIGMSTTSNSTSGSGAGAIVGTVNPPQYAAEDYAETGTLFMKVIGPTLYILRTKTINTEATSDDDAYRYYWQQIVLDVQLEDYVMKTARIAGIDLADDITAEELCDALNIKNTIHNELLQFSQTGAPKTFAWEQGDLSSTDGLEVENTNRRRSNFVSLTEGSNLYLYVDNITDYTLTFRVYFYDENKNYVRVQTYGFDPHTQSKMSVYVAGEKYARLWINLALYPNVDSVDDIIVRFYDDTQVLFATKQELAQTAQQTEQQLAQTAYELNQKVGKTANITPRTLDYFDYFSPNKSVVFIGDSITHGLGSSGFIQYDTTDSKGNTIHVYGNSEEYATLNNLNGYEAGVLLCDLGANRHYEAIDGNGWAHKLKKYLQNKFGCSVKNYGMSGSTTGNLLSQTMNTSNTGLDISGLETDTDGNVRVLEGLTKGFDTVFLMIGTNDRRFSSIDEFIYNLNKIVDYLRNTSDKQVILMSCIPVVSEDKTLTMAQINEAIQGVAHTYNVPFISLYNGLLNYLEQTGTELSELTTTGGIHPNDEGYEVMNALICDELGINNADKNYVDEQIAQLSEIIDTLKATVNELSGG